MQGHERPQTGDAAHGVTASRRARGTERRRTTPRCTIAAAVATALVCAVFVVTAGSASAETSSSTAVGSTRDAMLWPFSSTSPWNMPIGSGAEFETASAPRTAGLLNPDITPWVNAGEYSHPVYQASASDPMATMTWQSWSTQYRIPATATPAPGSDAHMHVVDPTKRFVNEAWLVSGSGTTWKSGYQVQVDLTSSGMGAGGVRAYGGSALGGLIRTWELQSGEIRHALAIALTNDQLRNGWVWPATTQDGDGAWVYKGDVPMGTLVAIPSTVDLTTLGLSADGLAVARALQNYGAYVVDRAGCFALYAEPNAEGTPQLNNIRNDLAKIRAQLRVVANNTASSVGGGGTPIAPLAPPLG